MTEPTRLEALRIDRKVRAEVAGILESCRDSSEMNEEEHPLHGDFKTAISLVLRFLNMQPRK